MMIFLHMIRDSANNRRNFSIREVKWLTATVLIFIAVYLILAVILAPEAKLEYHFYHERGAVTALSAILLSIAGGFAGFTFFLTKTRNNWFAYFWLCASLGLIFFAMDELLGFHEAAGRYLSHMLGPVQSFRNWNDIIVIIYGIVALPVFILFLPEILRYPKVAEFLIIAFLFYSIHTGIDSLVEPRTSWSIIIEESAKVMSAAFLMLSMQIATLGIMSRQ